MIQAHLKKQFGIARALQSVGASVYFPIPGAAGQPNTIVGINGKNFLFNVIPLDAAKAAEFKKEWNGSVHTVATIDECLNIIKE